MSHTAIILLALAFLIGWMVWRNGSRRHRDAGQDTETGNDDTGPKE